ncbi:hypothetical protein [Sinorhizobium meliloti]|uniref:hypothetical protein n=1 Tax=Rhizobium meliloti TaxID=382 RepID=UPI000FDC8C9B|nr:hypothetical protein [Sinorhizobium meliloti]RVI43668.1 hypothetical protein CN195_28230 [Sinorhizobium meliloti]
MSYVDEETFVELVARLVGTVKREMREAIDKAEREHRAELQALRRKVEALERETGRNEGNRRKSRHHA